MAPEDVREIARKLRALDGANVSRVMWEVWILTAPRDMRGLFGHILDLEAKITTLEDQRDETPPRGATLADTHELLSGDLLADPEK